MILKLFTLYAAVYLMVVGVAFVMHGMTKTLACITIGAAVLLLALIIIVHMPEQKPS